MRPRHIKHKAEGQVEDHSIGIRLHDMNQGLVVVFSGLVLVNVESKEVCASGN